MLDTVEIIFAVLLVAFIGGAFLITGLYLEEPLDGNGNNNS